MIELRDCKVQFSMNYFARQKSVFLIFLICFLSVNCETAVASPDPKRFQTLIFVLHASSTPLTAPATAIYRQTFSEQFAGVPQLFMSIYAFNIQNSDHIQFQLTNNKVLSQSFSEYTLWVGQTTNIFFFQASVLATYNLNLHAEQLFYDNSFDLCQYNCYHKSFKQQFLSITGLDYTVNSFLPNVLLTIIINQTTGNLTFGANVKLSKISYNIMKVVKTTIDPDYFSRFHYSNELVIAKYRVNFTLTNSKFPDQAHGAFLGLQINPNLTLMFELRNIKSQYSINLYSYESAVKGEPIRGNSDGSDGQVTSATDEGTTSVVDGTVYMRFLSLWILTCSNPDDNIHTIDGIDYCSSCASDCLDCIQDLCGSCRYPGRTLTITNHTTGGGVCTCPIGTYSANISTCANCDAKCISCSGSYWNCTECFPGYLFLGWRCVFPCFVVSELQSLITCSICAEGCAVCSSSTTCNHTMCESQNELYFNGSCYQICPDGMYGSRGICMKCKEECLTCQDYTTCLSCAEGFYLSGGVCRMCYILCKTCRGGATIDCQTCRQGVLQNDSSCPAPTFPSENQGNSTAYNTIVDCIDGYYYIQLQKSCQPCSDGCLQCPSPSFCYKCKGSYMLTGSSCSKCELISGFKYNSTEDKCLEICGDGKKLYARCDDGNSLSGDGCSSICMVEPNYTCYPTQAEDYCIRQHNEFSIEMNKSMVVNAIKVKLSAANTFSQYMLPPSISCVSPLNQSSLITFRVQKAQKTLIYEIDFRQNLQQHTCTSNLAVGLSVSFDVDTNPKSYLNPVHVLQNVQVYTSFIESLCIIGITLAFINHFFNYKASASFIEHSALYTVCLLQTSYIPSFVFRMTSGISYISLIFNKNFLQDPFRLNYIIGVESKISQSLLGIIVYLYIMSFVAIILGALLYLEKIHQKMAILFEGIISNRNKFVSETYRMYVPIVIVIIILGPKQKLSVLDCIFMVLLSSHSIFSIYVLIRLAFSKPYKFIKNNALIRRIRSCFFCIGIGLTKLGPDFGQLPTIVAFLLSISIFVYELNNFISKNSKTEQKSEHDNNIWRRTNSLNADIDLETSSLTKVSSMIKYTSIVQRLYNELFFIVQCLSILVVYYLDSAETVLNNSGIVNIFNLVLFLCVNICCLIMQIVFRIKKAFFSDIRVEISPTSVAENIRCNQESTQNMSLIALTKTKSTNSYGNAAQVLGDYRNPEEPVVSIIIEQNSEVLERPIQQEKESSSNKGGSQSYSFSENDIIMI